MTPRTRVLLAVAAALAVVLPLAATAAGGDPGAVPVAATATDGDPALQVGTEQVAEGASVYARSCAECHGRDLEGFAHFPALVGSRFRSTWSGGPVGDLHAYVVEQMPLGAGGTLADEAYAAVVAFLLERNGFEPGDLPFDPTDEAVLATELGFPEGTTP